MNELILYFIPALILTLSVVICRDVLLAALLGFVSILLLMISLILSGDLMAIISLILLVSVLFVVVKFLQNSRVVLFRLGIFLFLISAGLKIISIDAVAEFTSTAGFLSIMAGFIRGEVFDE